MLESFPLGQAYAEANRRLTRRAALWTAGYVLVVLPPSAYALMLTSGEPWWVLDLALIALGVGVGGGLAAKLFGTVAGHRALLKRDMVRLAGNRLSCQRFDVDLHAGVVSVEEVDWAGGRAYVLYGPIELNSSAPLLLLTNPYDGQPRGDADLRRLAESLRGSDKDTDRRAGAVIERLRPADDLY